MQRSILRAQAPCRAQPPLPKGTSPFRHQRRHRATAQQQAPGSSSGGADGASVASTSAPEAPAYPYNSGDSRTQKTTIEHILPGLSAAGQQKIGSGGVQAPWAMGWQMNERNMVWNDELKLRLIKLVASQELGVTEEELEERLASLAVLLPDLAPRLVQAPPERVAAMAAGVEVIGQRLTALRALLPDANVSRLVERRLSLLLEEDLGQVDAAVQRLRKLLRPSGINVDRFVEEFPVVLNVGDFELALEDAKRMMPNLDVAQTLRTNPDMILMLVKGKSLIPYDPAPPRW